MTALSRFREMLDVGAAMLVGVLEVAVHNAGHRELMAGLRRDFDALLASVRAIQPVADGGPTLADIESGEAIDEDVPEYLHVQPRRDFTPIIDDASVRVTLVDDDGPADELPPPLGMLPPIVCGACSRPIGHGNGECCSSLGHVEHPSHDDDDAEWACEQAQIERWKHECAQATRDLAAVTRTNDQLRDELSVRARELVEMCHAWRVSNVRIENAERVLAAIRLDCGQLVRDAEAKVLSGWKPEGEEA